MVDFNFSSPEFISLLKQRNDSAITSLVKKYNKQLFNAALGQGCNLDTAEELAQSVWHSFFAAIERFEGRSHIRTFLFGILYNKIKENWRLQAKFLDTKEDQSIEDIIDSNFSEDGLWAVHPTPPEQFVWVTQANKSIRECLDALQDKYKMAFYMKEVEGESSSFICNTLNISRTNLGVLLYRAKHMLRKCLESKSVTKEDIA